MADVIADWIRTRFLIITGGAILGYIVSLHLWPQLAQLLIAFIYLCGIYKLLGWGIWNGLVDGLFVFTAVGFIARWFYGVQLFLPY